MNRKHRSITSEQMFEHEMKDIIKAFEQKEGEDTWEAFSNHFVRLHKWILEDTITEYTKFMKYLTDLKEPIKNSLMSKRTILSGNATKFLESISLKMPEERFESINQMFITTIINIFGANNKLQRDRMLNCYKQIIANAKLPRMVSKFSLLIVNKKTRNNFDKMCILECLDTLITTNNPDTIKIYHSEIENLITSSIESPQPESRILTRSIFQSYKKVLPEEWAIFDEALTPQLKKTLNMPIPPTKKKISSSTTLLLKKKKAQTTPSSSSSVSPPSKITPVTELSSSSSATTVTVNKNPLRKAARPTITKPLLKARTAAMQPQGQQKPIKKTTQKNLSTTTSTSTTLKTKPKTKLNTTAATAIENNQESAGHKQESESIAIEQQSEQVMEQKKGKEREKEQKKELLNQNEITTTIDSSNIEEKGTEEEGKLKLSVPVTEGHKKKMDLITPPSSQDSTSKLLRIVDQDTSSQPPTMTPSHSTPSKKEYPINNTTPDSRPSCNTPEHPTKNMQSPTPSSSTSSPTILVSNRTEPIKKPTKPIAHSSFTSTSSTSSSTASIKPSMKRQRSSTGSISSTTSSTKSFPPSRFSTGSIASSKSISNRSSKIPLKRSSSTVTAATTTTTTTTGSKRVMIQERTRLNIIKQKQKEKENTPPDAKRMKVGKEEEQQQTKTTVRPPSLFDQYRSGRLGISRSISPSGFKKPPI